MISFYPGPSRIHDQIPKYVKDAATLGIMSMNHRSDEFIQLSKRTIALLKKRLRVPKKYTVFFTSSATECWEILAQSLITKKSYHIYNGAFGQKWFEYTQHITNSAQSFKFDKEEELDVVDHIYSSNDGVICITQNETSNGTQVSNTILKKLRNQNPNHLIAIDATSSMAGVKLDFKQADVWFASVQKCFGLPAGLAVMVCSPRALEQVKSKGEKKHYNSLLFMTEMMERWQTTYTPNVLGIYLLMRVLQDMKSINSVHKETLERFRQWEVFLRPFESIKMLINNQEVQSLTVLSIEAESKLVTKIKMKAKKQGILLGEGYGELKNNTFRIANFPAIKESEIKQLQKFLQTIE
jgi:phosphoserine aminotransferase